MTTILTGICPTFVEMIALKQGFGDVVSVTRDILDLLKARQFKRVVTNAMTHEYGKNSSGYLYVINHYS